MTKASLQQLYQEDFPLPYRQAMRRGAVRGYARLGHWMESAPELRSAYGKQARGYLINFFIAHHVRQELEKIGAAVNFFIEWNSKNSECHPIFQTKHFRISLCQLHSPRDFPRHAEFRENARATNQETLYQYWGEEEVEAGLISGLLTHGWKSLQFFQLAVPHPELREYIDRFDLLRQADEDHPRLAPEPAPPSPPSRIPDLATPKLKKPLRKKTGKTGSE